MEHGACRQRRNRVIIKPQFPSHGGAQSADPHAVVFARSKLFFFNYIKSAGEYAA
jgi:hypothetical protein